MVFLAVSSGSLRCLCSELYRARTFAGWCDPWLPVHPLQIPRCSNSTTLQLSQKIGFLGQVTQMFLGVIFGVVPWVSKNAWWKSCRLLRQSSPPDQHNFYAILSGSCEVLRILAANLRWLTWCWIFGWCHLSIYLIYLFICDISCTIYCTIYLSIELIDFLFAAYPHIYLHTYLFYA